MIRRLLCWLGFHKWELYCDECPHIECHGNCKNMVCKYCGERGRIT